MVSHAAAHNRAVQSSVAERRRLLTARGRCWLCARLRALVLCISVLIGITAVILPLSKVQAQAPMPPASDWSLPGLERGHLKLQAASSSFPADSLLRELGDAVIHDGAAVLRLNFGHQRGPWEVQAHYELLAAAGGRLELAQRFDDPALAPPVLPLESLRWLDLQATLHGGPEHVLAHRLDRLNIAWRGERLALRLGRQAVSWGNGLFYAPMDMFNPFAPAAVDTEYKRGDDMLHGQYLLDSGSDVQLILLQRGDGDVPGGGLGGRSAALKYHRFGVQRELDLLLASHLGEAVLGAGVVQALGEAVASADLVLVRSERAGRQRWVHSAVANLSTSWVAAGLNMSATLEYFFNGFGVAPADYPALLASLLAAQPSSPTAADWRAAGTGFAAGAQPSLSAGEVPPEQADALLARIRRGELYTLGRHYAAAAVQMELHPLLSFTPSVFANLEDRSVLFQAALRWEPAADWQLLAALTLPLGARGTEFGGLRLPGAPLTLAAGPGVYAQLAFYFD
jgi:hypothetical protein